MPLVDTVAASLLVGTATLVLAGRGLISWIKYRRALHAARAAAFLALQIEAGQRPPEQPWPSVAFGDRGAKV